MRRYIHSFGTIKQLNACERATVQDASRNPDGDKSDKTKGGTVHRVTDGGDQETSTMICCRKVK